MRAEVEDEFDIRHWPKWHIEVLPISIVFDEMMESLFGLFLWLLGSFVAPLIDSAVTAECITDWQKGNGWTARVFKRAANANCHIAGSLRFHINLKGQKNQTNRNVCNSFLNKIEIHTFRTFNPVHSFPFNFNIIIIPTYKLRTMCAVFWWHLQLHNCWLQNTCTYAPYVATRDTFDVSNWTVCMHDSCQR